VIAAIRLDGELAPGFSGRNATRPGKHVECHRGEGSVGVDPDNVGSLPNLPGDEAVETDSLFLPVFTLAGWRGFIAWRRSE
jgi:hypothetical protein